MKMKKSMWKIEPVSKCIFCLFYIETPANTDILDENGTGISNAFSVSSRKCSI